MSTAGRYYVYTEGYHDKCGGYHEYTRGCSVHWGLHTNSVVIPVTFPRFMITPSVLRISPQCTNVIPTVYS